MPAFFVDDKPSPTIFDVSIPYLYAGQRDRQAHRAHPFRIEA